MGSLDVGSVCKADVTWWGTVRNNFDLDDVPDASSKSGGPDTVGSRGTPSGGVSVGAFASTDGPTSGAVVSRVAWSRLVVVKVAPVSYRLIEFVVWSASEVSGKMFSSIVGSYSGEGIGVAVSTLSRDTVSVAHEGRHLPAEGGTALHMF